MAFEGIRVGDLCVVKETEWNMNGGRDTKYKVQQYQEESYPIDRYSYANDTILFTL